MVELELGFSVWINCGDDDDDDDGIRVCSDCGKKLKLLWWVSLVDIEVDDDGDDDGDDDDDGEEFCATFSSNLGIQNRLSVSTNLLLLESILRWRACFCTLVLQ